MDVGSDVRIERKENSPTLFITGKGNRITFDTEEALEVSGENFASFLVLPVGVGAFPGENTSLIGEGLKKLPLTSGIGAILVRHAHLSVMEYPALGFDLDGNGVSVSEPYRHILPCRIRRCWKKNHPIVVVFDHWKNRSSEFGQDIVEGAKQLESSFDNRQTLGQRDKGTPSP